ncbi:MAG: ATP-binding protein [Acidobacteria bacterium]|jgi:predicted ATPase|nr:ATP-binding protein [Acidobacteriota bacterium]
MEIKILNFGPIGEFEFDLKKDLTIIYGKNNIGKSYSMAVVYLLLKSLSNIDHFRLSEITRNTIEKNELLVKDQLKQEKECNLTKIANDIIKDILNEAVSEGLDNSFKNTFGELVYLRNFKSKQPPVIQITISKHTIHLCIEEKIKVKEFSLNKEVIGQYSNEDEIISEHKQDIFQLDFSKSKDVPNPFFPFIDDRIRSMIERIENEIGAIYFFPAGRTGLEIGLQSLFPIFAELSKKRSRITEKIDLPIMAEPIADYILQLSEIDSHITGQNRYRDIAALIEKKILKGEVGFDQRKKRFTYKPIDSELILDMSFVSSMVSELSPIVGFLKYILRDKTENVDIKPAIFIEEPEAHLHPEAQVQLVDIFVKLAEAGVKLIITSHSNYMFNKLTNMVIGKTLHLSMFAPVILKDTDVGSIGKSMEADSLGIEDENFMDTADALYEERENIIESLNASPND